MKKGKIKNHINDLFQKINELSKKSADDFRATEIHRLRIETKKLRAFLRLLNMRPGKPAVIKIPPSIKKFYKKAGDVRNLQNHQAKIRRLFFKKQKPVSYQEILKNSISKYKVEMHDAFPSADKFTYAKEKMLNKTPNKITDKTAHNFITQKKIVIAAILATEKTDEALHDLRKNLKDIQYNKKWIQHSIDLTDLPFATNMKELIELLGIHQDYVIHLYYLQSSDIEKLNEEDRKLIHETTGLLQKEKAAVKKKILEIIAAAN